MAVHVQKIWNKAAAVISDGMAVAFSSSGHYLYVLSAEGARVAVFKARDVKQYWVEAGPHDSVAAQIALRPRSVNRKK